MMIGLHRTFLGSIERGEHSTSVLNLVQIAKVLQVEVPELLKGVEPVELNNDLYYAKLKRKLDIVADKTRKNKDEK